MAKLNVIDSYRLVQFNFSYLLRIGEHDVIRPVHDSVRPRSEPDLNVNRRAGLEYF